MAAPADWVSGVAAEPYVFLAALACVAGLARGFSGFGAALIFVPLASSVVGPKLAAPILLAIDNVAALGLVPAAWRAADRSSVGWMALGAAICGPFGAYALGHWPTLDVRWAMAGLAFALLALLMSGWRYRGRPNAPVTMGVGAIAGFLSGLAQAGGPPVVAYWLGGGSRAETTRANIILFFVASSVITTTGYLWQGLFSSRVLWLAVAAGPGYALGLALGSRLFGRASEASFRRISYALIALAAVASLPALDGWLR